jgi:hypothetical protein
MLRDITANVGKGKSGDKGSMMENILLVTFSDLSKNDVENWLEEISIL